MRGATGSGGPSTAGGPPPPINSPRSKLPPCLCSAAKRRNFVRGAFSTDAATLFFASEDVDEGSVVRVALRDVFSVHAVKKEAAFVVLTLTDRSEVCFQPDSTHPNAVASLKEHLACLVSVASKKSMEDILQDDEEGGNLFARLKGGGSLKVSPRGTTSPRGGGGGGGGGGGSLGFPLPAAGTTQSPRKGSMDATSTTTTTTGLSKSTSALPRSINNNSNNTNNSASSLGRKLSEKVGIHFFSSAPAIKTTSVVGWLWKSFPTSWKRKYFMLMGNGNLVYYENEEVSRVKGHAGSGFLDLQFLKEARTGGTFEVDGTTLWRFDVTLTTGRQWLLAAESSDLCLRWLRSLTAKPRQDKRRQSLSSPPPILEGAEVDEEEEEEEGEQLGQRGLQQNTVADETFEFHSEAVLEPEVKNPLDRLLPTLASYEADGDSGRPLPQYETTTNTGEMDEFVNSLKHSLGKVLALDDEEFYNVVADGAGSSDAAVAGSRPRAGTSSEVDRMLADLDSKIFGDSSGSGIEAAVYGSIEEHVARLGGGGHEVRIEAAARLKGRIQTMRMQKDAPRPPSFEGVSKDEELPPLPEIAPSIHDHEAYREYIRLRRAWDRRKRKGNEGWARPVLPQQSSAEHVVDGSAHKRSVSPTPVVRKPRSGSFSKSPPSSLVARSSRDTAGAPSFASVVAPLPVTRARAPSTEGLQQQEAEIPEANVTPVTTPLSPRRAPKSGPSSRWESPTSPGRTERADSTSPRVGGARESPRTSPRSGASSPVPKERNLGHVQTSPRAASGHYSPGRTEERNSASFSSPRRPLSPLASPRTSPRSNTSPRATTTSSWVRPGSVSQHRSRDAEGVAPEVDEDANTEVIELAPL